MFHSGIKRISILLSFCLLLFAAQNAAAWGTPSTLQGVAAELATQIAEKHPDAVFYMRPESFREEGTDRMPALSVALCSELQAELQKNNARLTNDLTTATRIVGGTFRFGKKTFFNLRIQPVAESGGFTMASSHILTKNLAADMLRETLDTICAKLVAELLESPAAMRAVLGADHHLQVFVNPILHGQGKYASEFSRDMLGRIQVRLVENDMIELVQPPSAVQLTRGLKKMSDGKVGVAAATDAEAILDGFYLAGNGQVRVSLTISDMSGHVLASAAEGFPKDLVSLPMDNPQAATIATLLDTQKELSTERVVRASVNKGEGDQLFLEDEVLSILVTSAKPLYIHVYNVNPDNGVTLLHPTENEFSKVEPGQPYLIEDIKVVPPFGVDSIKVFASNVNIPMPTLDTTAATRSYDEKTRGLMNMKQAQKELAGAKGIHPYDLVAYYRGTAARLGAELHEDTIFITTKSKP